MNTTYIYIHGIVYYVQFTVNFVEIIIYRFIIIHYIFNLVKYHKILPVLYLNNILHGFPKLLFYLCN